MNNRQSRTPARVQQGQPPRPTQSHLINAAPVTNYPTAPNAAMLIDFDNVTMGIRSELAVELKNLLSSDVIKGKVAIRRAYADWRRYPQYVLPLTETSIDLIYAPAYGSARKNATDIRLAIDAMELVFTRPEIGTIVLLSGDSDFSSLVIKLKEYGKYIIGVGIRESSSDLLVQNCDEYYSYNALAGLVKTGDEPTTKWDPWELASESVTRMKRNGDVMRADRLKQVMQEIDSTFDEKDLGMAKFSRFVTEAAQRGILHATKLDNGQLEVDLPRGAAEVTLASAAATSRADGDESAVGEASAPRAVEGEREGGSRDRGRRGRRDRGRDRRPDRTDNAAQPAASTGAPAADVPTASRQPAVAAAPVPAASVGERLTRAEAFDLVRRAVAALDTDNGKPVPASRVREKAAELLGRDSETLSERYFGRILQDAHDGEVIDLKRRGDDFEVTRAQPIASVAEQLAVGVVSPSTPQPTAPASAGIGARPTGRSGRAGFGKRLGEAPAHLLSIGVVGSGRTAEVPAATLAGEPASSVANTPSADAQAIADADVARAAPAPDENVKPARKTRGRKAARSAEAGESESGGSTKATKKAPAKPRAKKASAAGSEPRKSAAKKKKSSAVAERS